MPTYTFPVQKTVFSDKPFSSKLLVRVFEELFRIARPFTGFLKVAGADGGLRFLFFLQSNPYAAGKVMGNKPGNLTIADFFAETLALPADQLKVSLHETDPVLLKSMLIFLQNEPTAKAPVNLIDLEEIAQQIQGEEGDALIALEKAGMFNFFFFKNGKAAFSHRADTAWNPASDLTQVEQMLLYGFESEAGSVVAHIYRSVGTEMAADVEQISRERLLQLAQHAPAKGAAPGVAAEPQPRRVTVTVVDGVQQGESFSVVLPCMIGRKDCDLVLTDNLISRRHVLLSEVAGQLTVEDRGSTNGTFLNGVEIQRVAITPEDVLTLGETSLKISG